MKIFFELISFLEKNTILCEFLDYIILGLTCVNTILKYFGCEFSHFYYVTFFGLLPYRIIKAILDEKVISFLTLIKLFSSFCLIWRYIDFFIPFFFGSYFGQWFLSLSLIILDKFLFVDDILKKNPKLRIFSYIILFLSLITYWLSIGGPPFFLLTVAQTFAWFTNFAKHFLQDGYIKRYMEDCSMLLKDSSDFKWSHLVGLMSYVSKSKHERSIINVSGLWVNNLKFPNIAKRYFPVEDSMTITNPIVKNTVSLSILTFSGFMLFGMVTKFRVRIMEKFRVIKEKDDAQYEEFIIGWQEEIEKKLNQANNASQNYIVIQEKLKKRGVKNIALRVSSETNENKLTSNPSIYGPFSFENSITDKNKNYEIVGLFIKLTSCREHYLITIDYIKTAFLRTISIKKIIDCDVTVVNLNRIEKLFTPNGKTCYQMPGIGLKPDKLLQKAQEDSKIQALLEEVFLTQQGCPPLDLHKLEGLFVEIYPLLDPLFEEIRDEFLNENIARFKKQHSTNSNLEESNSLDD